MCEQDLSCNCNDTTGAIKVAKGSDTIDSSCRAIIGPEHDTMTRTKHVGSLLRLKSREGWNPQQQPAQLGFVAGRMVVKTRRFQV